MSALTLFLMIGHLFSRLQRLQISEAILPLMRIIAQDPSCFITRSQRNKPKERKESIRRHHITEESLLFRLMLTLASSICTSYRMDSRQEHLSTLHQVSLRQQRKREKSRTRSRAVHNLLRMLVRSSSHSAMEQMRHHL